MGKVIIRKCNLLNYNHMKKVNSKATLDQTRKPLSPEDREKQRSMASVVMVARFSNREAPWKKWSNEWKQPKKIVNINDAINEMMRIVEAWPKRNIVGVALFDVRATKSISAENKIYQYENGSWNMLKPVSW